MTLKTQYFLLRCCRTFLLLLLFITIISNTGCMNCLIIRRTALSSYSSTSFYHLTSALPALSFQFLFSSSSLIISLRPTALLFYLTFELVEVLLVDAPRHGVGLQPAAVAHLGADDVVVLALLAAAGSDQLAAATAAAVGMVRDGGPGAAVLLLPAAAVEAVAHDGARAAAVVDTHERLLLLH